jgi:FkbM family methyltransferase
MASYDIAVEASQRQFGSRPWWVFPVATVCRNLPTGRERALQWLLGSGTKPFWMPMTETYGYSFICEPEDKSCSEVCLMGIQQPMETMLLKRLLHTGMTFVDVGARWGYFSLLAAHCVGEQGRVVSLEPDLIQFRRLFENVHRNGLNHVISLAVAAADRSCDVHLNAKVPAPRFDLRVVAEPIDEIVDALEISNVDLLKMDIEGAERLALRGMETGLRAGRYRRILLELHHAMLAERGEDSCEVLDFLIAAGYHAWWLDPRGGASARLGANVRPLDLSREIKDRVSLLWLAPGEEL